MNFSTHLKIYTGLAKRKATLLYHNESVRGFIGVAIFLYVSWYILQLPLPKKYR